MALAFAVRARRRQAFVVLSTVGTVLLVAAVPFKFQGVSWPVLWLVEAQVLALCGLRMGEPVFRRLGLLAGLATGAVLAARDVVPLMLFRLDYPDPSRHMQLTVALALAAILYWIHGEVYPRRWPQILESEFEAGAMTVTSYLAAAAAGAALWVVLPDEWLPIGWLALFLVLTVLGLRFRALSLLLQGDLLSLTAAGVLIFHHVLPLVSLRLSSHDPSHHAIETAVLGLAALAFWIRGELLPRALPKSWTDSEAYPDLATWQGFVLPAASCLGAAAAGAALWTALPEGWIVVGWLVLAVLLGYFADRAKSSVLAFEADVLALAAVIGWFPWNLWSGDPSWWTRKAPELAAIALLYAGMVRKTAPEGLRVPGGGAYSWVASALLAIAAWDLAPGLHLAVIWGALGVALFEVGRLIGKTALRWQGFVLAGLAFGRCIFFDIDSGGPAAPAGNSAFSFVNSGLFEALVLAGAGWWFLERTMNRERIGRGDAHCRHDRRWTGNARRGDVVCLSLSIRLGSGAEWRCVGHRNMGWNGDTADGSGVDAALPSLRGVGRSFGGSCGDSRTVSRSRRHDAGGILAGTSVPYRSGRSDSIRGASFRVPVAQDDVLGGRIGSVAC